jgi:hypothetical protein
MIELCNASFTLTLYEAVMNFNSFTLSIHMECNASIQGMQSFARYSRSGSYLIISDGKTSAENSCSVISVLVKKD